MKSRLVPAVVLAGLMSIPAHAANLVTNPGFETGDLTGWSVAGGDNHNVSMLFPHSGTFHWRGADISSPSTLSQTLATTVDETYTFSFYLRNNSGDPFNAWGVQWNGGTLDSDVDAAAFGYTLMSFSVTGTGSDTIAFVLQHAPSAYYLDDVSVAVETPEPASLAILGLGLAGFSLARLARRR